jgi:solute carrier family 25 citrate transporter 1
MQSLEARQLYRNSFHCAYRIFTEEGLLRFWTGTTPRLARLSVSEISCKHRIKNDAIERTPQLSGGIVFTVYEATIRLLQK